MKDRTLMVISIASAAGGSKVANILGDPTNYALDQTIVAWLAQFISGTTDAYKNLKVPYASAVVAPYKENPRVPFFMVSGYSPKLLSEESGVIISVHNEPEPLSYLGADRKMRECAEFLRDAFS